MSPTLVGEVFGIIGQVIAYTGAVGLATYAIFKWLAARWLEGKFAEKLESFKHKQNQELEKLRFQINTLLDRNTILHQKEFEILPEAWAALNQAFMASKTIAYGFQQFANPDLMNQAQLDRWLERVELESWQKDELRSETSKSKYYSTALSYQELNRAEKFRYEFQFYLSKNGIFLPVDLREAFDSLNMLMLNANLEREVNLQSPGVAPLRDAAKVLREEGDRQFKALEVIIRDRLWSSTRVPT